METISRFGKVYFAANIINRSAGFILIPVYTHVLTLEEYGLYAIILTVSDLFAIMFGMGFTAAMSRFYFDHSNDESHRNLVVSTTLISYFAIATLILICAYPLARLIVFIIFGSNDYVNLFVFAFAGLIFTLLFEIVVGYAVIRKKVWTYFSMALAKAMLFIACNIVLVVYIRLGVPGIIYATAGSLGVISVFLTILILRHTGLKFSWVLCKRMLLYGLPLIPSSFANAALPVVERHFLNLLAGPSAVGIYSLGHRLASMLQMFIAKPFSEIFFVRRFETLAKGEDQNVFNRILLLFIALMTTCALGLSLFAHEIVNLISPSEYLAILPSIPILGLCFILSSLNLNIEIGIAYMKKTWAIPLIGLVVLVSSIPANYFLIGRYGILGASLALLLVNTLRIVTTVAINSILGTRSIHIDWKRTVGILTAGTLTGSWFVYILPPSFHPGWMLVKLSTVVLFVIILIKTPILGIGSKQELDILKP